MTPDAPSAAIPEQEAQVSVHTAESMADTPDSDLQPGARAQGPHHLPLAAWKQIAKRMWVMVGYHNLSLLAAGTAFFTFLAITPLLAATVMMYGLLGDVDTVQRQMAQIITMVPSDVASVIEEQLLAVVTTSGGVAGLTLVVSLSLAIFGAMRAAKGLIGALNIINSEHESRNFISLTLRAGGLTLAAIMIALTGLISGGLVAWLQLQTSFVLGPLTETFYKLVTWALAMALGTTGFALIMRYGPDRKPAKWRWLSPGSLLSTFAWLGVSFGFSLYVQYVSDYNATYGSLSAVVVFLMWLFLTSFAILIGATLNAELERQTMIDSTVGPDRPLGERGAVMADHAIDGSPNASVLEKQRRRRAQRHANAAQDG